MRLKLPYDLQMVLEKNELGEVAFEGWLCQAVQHFATWAPNGPKQAATRVAPHKISGCEICCYEAEQLHAPEYDRTSEFETLLNEDSQDNECSPRLFAHRFPSIPENTFNLD